MNDFSLAGFGEKGKKTWDLAGKSADIFNDVVKLKDIIGNMYGRDEDIRLTADRGDFNKTDGSVHLKQNVVITSSGGTRLTTPSLDWDRKNQVITTQDLVAIQRENMTAHGRGATVHTNSNEIDLEKEVKVDILPVEEEKQEAGSPKDKTVITCDGPLHINYKENMATFNQNVKVERPDLTIFSDAMDVYFAMSSKSNESSSAKDKTPKLMGTKINRINCRGNVKIVRDQNVSYSDEAIYSAAEKKVTLLGNPKLILYSTEDLGASFGN